MPTSKPRTTGLASYQAMAWSPAEQEALEYGKTLAELQEEAEQDGYEAYANLLPFNHWDYLDGEEPSDTWLEAIEKIAGSDDYSLYDGAKHPGTEAIELAIQLQKANNQRVGTLTQQATKTIRLAMKRIQVPAINQELNRIANRYVEAA